MAIDRDKEKEKFNEWASANMPTAKRSDRQLAFRAWCAALGEENAVPRTAEEQAMRDKDIADERAKVKAKAAKERAKAEKKSAKEAEKASEDRAKEEAAKAADREAVKANTKRRRGPPPRTGDNKGG